jgi:hypothetical protein
LPWLHLKILRKTGLFLVVITLAKETKASNATAGIFEAEFIDINEPYILKKLVKYNVGL